MTDALAAALAAVRGRAELGALRRGIEKESLRVTPAGELALSPHPRALGSPLVHPHITTDFSEAQLELITGVHTSADSALAELADIHRFVYANIGAEMLWTASLPCRLGKERDIPIARFGTSNAGRLKTIYRMGLSHRYGRRMQTISGIHYNFSVPETLWPAIAASRGEKAERDFVTRAYFGLIRNFRRYSWLLIYLFGASPAACGSFVEKPSGLRRLGESSLYLPHATSLRMGRLGYQSDAQASLHISYNSLAQYAATMRAALTAPYPAYEAIGVQGAREEDGEEEYRQLNTALLQIENEFYGTIRPKRRVRSGERPLDALGERGVEYVEVRCMDLDPFLPMGIDAATCLFLDVFLLVCLLDASPPDSRGESEILAANQLAVVERGRAPGLALDMGNGQMPMVDWAAELLDRCQQVASVLDEATGDDRHTRPVQAQRLKVDDPVYTPSARVLEATKRDASFFRYGLRRSTLAKGWFAERPLDAIQAAELQRLSTRSLTEQARLEATAQQRFDRYLARYLELGESSASA